MKEEVSRKLVAAVCLVLLFCMVLRGWDAIFSFVGIVLTAIIPLVLGACIAYVIAIPTRFLSRHFFPNCENRLLAAIRNPFSLVVTVCLSLSGIILASVVLVPALIDTVTMVQRNGQGFVEDVIQMPLFEPVRQTIHDFITGDLVEDFKNLDIGSLVQGLFSGTVGSITTQLFTVVSTVMTGFFGMLFSFILLTDTTDAAGRLMMVIAEYLGPKKAERLSLWLGVADASFHNFIVRQFLEAVILGSVATLSLIVMRYPYALGVGVLMGLAALVPIVGYPVGLLVGAFMIAINNVWLALLYILIVGATQMLEATFVLPHVGDPRTVLPPVWVTVGVTIGGGVAGFVGMLVAIPIASTIRQLIVIDIRRRHQLAESREGEQAQQGDAAESREGEQAQQGDAE